MRLHSATVRNYRIHGEVSVEFDESRTLIGGPNECGKSTLIEAIHRGLFLRSRTAGEAQKGMVSNKYPGHPEVEVTFSTGGKKYQLTKRFSGSNGTTTLTETGGKTWQGEEAESHLNALLGVEDIGGGRGITDRILQQWAHLWVWQGMSGSDPCKSTAAEQQSLLQRLQEEGGAVAMQSACDAEVAQHFAELCDAFFTQNGNPKKGSPLQRAESALEAASAERHEAEERLQRLDRAVEEYEQAAKTIRQCEVDLERLSQELGEVSKKREEAAKLQSREQQQAAEAASAEEKHAALQQTEQTITSLRRDLQTLKTEIEPQLERCRKIQEKRQAQQQRAEEAAQASEASTEAARSARFRRDLARAWVERFDCEEKQAALEKRAEQARGIEETIASLRETRAQLPELDGEDLEDLRELNARADKARAALDAMAAGIEVVTATETIRIGEEEAPEGSDHTVTEATDLRIGNVAHLRIRPGGGDSLARAREERRTARESLARQLDELGLDSVENAARVLAQRNDLDAKIQREEDRLEDIDDGHLQDDRAAAQTALTAAQAEVERREKQVPEARKPARREEAVTWRAEEEKAVERAEEAETEKSSARQQAAEALKETDAALQKANAEVESRRNEISNKEAQLDFLVEKHGEDASRQQALKEAATAHEEAANALRQTREQLEALQPEALETDHARLQRSLEHQKQQREDGVKSRAANEALLRSDGSEDPQAELERAIAREESAQESYNRIRRKADAYRLLDDLFVEQQKALADRFTQPLAERITGYLRNLYGPSARAAVTFEDGAFQGIELIRSGHAGAISFDSLSGGTQEQVAAAVRMAVAEVLAADHGGSLPVVFDDAFANSDPERIQSVQRMLDYAATRGLQVIVLTCNPSDYAALGARQIRLSPGATAEPASSTSTTASSRPATGSDVDAETSVPWSEPSNGNPAEEDCAEYLAVLRSLDGKSGNQALREALGWPEQRYEIVKSHLIDQGVIIPGRGRGGSVALNE